MRTRRIVRTSRKTTKQQSFKVFTLVNRDKNPIDNNFNNKYLLRQYYK